MARHLKAPDDLEPAADTITLDAVHEMLCAAIRSGHLPGKGSKEVDRLWRCIRAFQEQARDRKTLPEWDAAADSLAKAVDVLIEGLPALIQRYDDLSRSQSEPRDGFGAMMRAFRGRNLDPREGGKDAATAQALLSAATAFRKAGLPLRGQRAVVTGHRIEGIAFENWADSWAPFLMGYLRDLFPTISKAASYRFIAAVAVPVLGVALAERTVETEMKLRGL